MNKKNLLLTVISILLLTNLIYAQGRHRKVTPEKIKNRTVYVLAGDDSTSFIYKAFKKSLEENWKIGRYKFATDKEFEKLKKDTSNFFLIFQTLGFSTDYNKLGEAIMGKNKTNWVNAKVILSDFNTDYYTYENEEWGFTYASTNGVCGYSIYDFDGVKLKYYINYSIQTIHNDLLGINTDGTNNLYYIYSKDYEEYAHIDIVKLKNKVIYIADNTIDENLKSPEKIKEVCDLNIKIVTEKELFNIIESKPANTAYVLATTPFKGRSWNMCIIDAQNGMTYYSNTKIITQGITVISKKNLKWLCKEMDNKK